MMNTILLTNIQRFSIHDGPGIRTTVFLKGCSLRCPWCSNPENLSRFPETYIKDGVIGTYGKYFEPDTLVHECLKDKIFYEGSLNDPTLWNITTESDIENLPGGVTFSGGECLLQMKALVPVCIALHEENTHITVETSLFCSRNDLTLALEHIDFFFVDIKILQPELCESVERGNLDLFLTNLHNLFSWKDLEGIGKPVVIRIPVIGSYTDTEENRKAVYNLLEKYRYNILKIELIKEHNLGESKYKTLNMEMDYHGVTNEMMETYKLELSDLGIMTEICMI